MSTPISIYEGVLVLSCEAVVFIFEVSFATDDGRIKGPSVVKVNFGFEVASSPRALSSVLNDEFISSWV